MTYNFCMKGIGAGLLAAALLGSASCAPNATVRGELSFDGKRDSLKVCGSTETYWVRVLASNPHFLLFKRAEELKGQKDKPVIAVLEGQVTAPTSFQPAYAPDGVLNVERIHSVEQGTCS